MEWILNIWSLVLLTMFIVGYRAIRNRKALALLSFTHFYIVDTLFSIAFTIFFCVKWFKIQRHTKTSTVIYSTRDASTATTATNLFSDSATLAQESATSIILTVFVLLARIYFAFIIVGYARQLIRQQNLRRYNGSPKGSWSAILQQALLTPCEYFWTGFTSSSSSTSASSPLMSGNGNDVDEDRIPLSDTKYEDEEESLVRSSR